MSLYTPGNGSTPSGFEDRTIWDDIPETDEIESILQKSEEQAQLIYKHSHRCSVSLMAKEELEEIAEELSSRSDLYMVDVIGRREVSNAIASKLNVRHESPQVIILKDREVVWKGSHWDVKGADILDRLK